MIERIEVWMDDELVGEQPARVGDQGAGHEGSRMVRVTLTMIWGGRRITPTTHDGFTRERPRCRTGQEPTA